jgi:cytochrome c-type biogenesis protein
MTIVLPPVGERNRVPIKQVVIFLALGCGLGLLLIAAKDQVEGLQGGLSPLATAASALPFGYAFGAGLLAAVNPCGVLLLPSLVAYYLGGEAGGTGDWLDRGSRALVFGLMATLGFLCLFALVGSVFAASGRALGEWFPRGGLAVGVGLAALGVWTVISGHSIGVAGASRAMGTVRVASGLRSPFLFGTAYGVASLACTLPVFLVVVGTALTAGGFSSAAGQFLAYGLGMGLMLTTVVVTAAFFSGAVTRALKGVMPYMHRAGAALLVGAGFFMIYYWLAPAGLIR